jgi:hypothetical protein
MVYRSSVSICALHTTNGLYMEVGADRRTPSANPLFIASMYSKGTDYAFFGVL